MDSPGGLNEVRRLGQKAALLQVRKEGPIVDVMALPRDSADPLQAYREHLSGSQVISPL